MFNLNRGEIHHSRLLLTTLQQSYCLGAAIITVIGVIKRGLMMSTTR